MSLINDALKRAREQQKERPNPPPTGLPLQPVDDRGRTNAGGRFIYPLLLVVTLGLAAWFFWQWARTSRPVEKGPIAAVSVSPEARAPGSGSPTSAAPQPAVPSAPAHPVVQVSTTLVARVPALPPQQAPASVPQPVPASVLPQPATLSSASGPPPAAPPGPAPSTGVALAPAPVIQPAVVSAPAPVAPEPAAPVAAPAPAASFPDIKLQAIFYRLNKPSVMINGKVVYTGEMVEGAKVTRIERDHAEVMWKGETRSLHLR
jgi:hypothetical protein